GVGIAGGEPALAHRELRIAEGPPEEPARELRRHLRPQGGQVPRQRRVGLPVVERDLGAVDRGAVGELVAPRPDEPVPGEVRSRETAPVEEVAGQERPPLVPSKRDDLGHRRVAEIRGLRRDPLKARLAEDVEVEVSGGAPYQWDEARAVEAGRDWKAEQLEDRRHDVDVAYRGGHDRLGDRHAGMDED